MERDLDDDIPEAFPDDDEEEDEEEEEDEFEEHDFNNQPDLDDDIPSAADDDEEEEEEEAEGMDHDLDDDIPEAAENRSDQEDEWQHTDTDAEFDDEDEEISFAQSLRASTTSSRGGLPPPPSVRRPRETEAQRRFLQRWSGGGDAFDTSGMLVDEDDSNLRSSITSQTSRRGTGTGTGTGTGAFGRFPRRRTGGPRDSLDY